MSFSEKFKNVIISQHGTDYHIIKWLKDSKYRFDNDLNDSKKIEYLKKICLVESEQDRKLMFELFKEIEKLSRGYSRFEEEYEIMEKSLLKFQEEINKEEAYQEAKENAGVK